MLAELLARVRSIWRGVVHTRQVDADLNEEFRLHIELRASDLVRAGMSPADAARKARAEFGSTQRHLEKARIARGLRWFDEMRISWLDVKLGSRMLVKYPVLTIVGGFSMAFAIWVGAGTFEAIRQLVFPVIPLPASDRIVVLQNWDAAANRPELRATHDFVVWHDALTSVEDVSAYRTLIRNVEITKGLAEPVYTAEVTGAAFRALRVPALLGRTLAEADERAGAPVAVIGYDLWKTRFQGDSGVIGREVRISGVPATIVGVMPRGFAFPSTQELWVPLTINGAGSEPREGMAIRIFGRLAPGATLERARTELASLGRTAATDLPRTHEHLRPQLFTFAQSVRAIGGPGESMTLLAGNVFVVMLLVLVCANVGLLMFARAATRETEIVVRSALGAGRKRIVMQLFAEALVLGGVAAVVGLTAAGWGVRWGLDLMRGELTDGSGNFPFWVDGGLSPLTVVYAALLTVLAAAIAGVLPGLRITRNLGDRLKRATAGGGGAAQFGGVWTAIIVVQIAVTMGFPVVTFFVRRDAVRLETQPLPFPVDQYLAVRLEMERYPPEAGVDTGNAAFEARYVAAAQKLEQRLEADSGVAGVVFAEQLPREYHPNHQVEVEEGAVAPKDERGHVVASTHVDPRYLDVLGVSMLSGRWFNRSEATPDARVVVVNKAFVDRVMGGRNPIGRRIRYPRSSTSESPPWYEIIGVAPDMGTNSGWGPAGIYHPLVRSTIYPLNVAIHVRGDPNAFAPRLRAIATDVDPTLRLAELMPLRDVVNPEVRFHEFWVRMTTIVSAMVLVLSLVAIYAVMSFAVSRRTREIGVRIALGGRPRHIVSAVFAQPLRQLGIGLIAGVALVAYLTGMMKSGVPSAGQILMLGVYAAAMTAVCMIACVVPTRRALAVEPTEALREY